MAPKEHNLSSSIRPSKLFRMPWTMVDNSLTWLEPTRKCNITCDACFASNDPDSEKSLSDIETDIVALLRLRRCDGMLIAGGEPLTHPKIVEIVRMVSKQNIKPVLLSNGMGLERDLVYALKKAGLFGFTFHVDSHQSRPGWEGKNEIELNDLRHELARIVYEAGGLICGFNMTIFPDTVEFIPGIVRWASRNADMVQSYSLIALRLAEADNLFDYYAGGNRIDIGSTVYYSPHQYAKLSSSDLFAGIREAIPEFELCAYLSGTALSDAVKWAVGCRIGSREVTYGNLGPKSMEFLQNIHHFVTGRYLSFSRPGLNRRAGLLFVLGLFDRRVRKAFRSYLASVLRNPAILFERLYAQTIVVEQPSEILPTGEEDLCDGCPNKTLWRGRLISACVLEGYLKYNAPIIAMPKPHQHLDQPAQNRELPQ